MQPSIGQRALPTPFLLFLGDVPNENQAKTAFGIRDWAPQLCVGEFGSGTTVTLGLPVLTPREAFLGPSEAVPVESAVGRISCESIAGYPPGVPALLPGERVTAEVIAYLRALIAAGARLHGAADPELATVRVVAQDAVGI